MQAATLFFVNAENHTLECLAWGQSHFSNCSVLTGFPSHSVAPESRQISATLLLGHGEYPNYLSLLLSYQDTSHRLSFMLGYMDTNISFDWIWRNETDTFHSVSLTAGANPSSTAYVPAACTGAWYQEDLKNCSPSPPCKKDPSLSLFCFVRKHNEPTVFSNGALVQYQAYDNVTSPGKLTIDGCSFKLLPMYTGTGLTVDRVDRRHSE